MASPSVIVVDDDASIRTSLAKILENEGYAAETAATGREAIQKCKDCPYDLALLDIKLPDIDGVQLLKELHANCSSMIKVMVTGHAGLDNALQCLLLGASAYIVKPIRPDELLKIVAEALNER